MDKLKKILCHVECTLSLEVNRHRAYYERIEDAVDELIRDESISQDLGDKIIESNNLVSLWVYPKTPIGFYAIHGYDIDMVLDAALARVCGEMIQGEVQCASA